MDCIFCRIAKGEVPTDKVYEDDNVVAFNDLSPQAPVHVLVIPKKHIDGVIKIGEGEGSILSSIFKAINDVAKKKKIEGSGFRVVANHGKDAGQAVGHLHFHVIGGRSMEWPPG